MSIMLFKIILSVKFSGLSNTLAKVGKKRNVLVGKNFPLSFVYGPLPTNTVFRYTDLPAGK